MCWFVFSQAYTARHTTFTAAPFFFYTLIQPSLIRAENKFTLCDRECHRQVRDSFVFRYLTSCVREIPGLEL